MRKMIPLLLLCLPLQTWGFCFDDAATKTGIDPILLVAIADGESSMNPMAQGINVIDGAVVSEDIGVMQISSPWLKSRWFREAGITRERLYKEPCLNVQIGAEILAKGCDLKSMSWDCVGAYNAGMRQSKKQQDRRYHYSLKVYKKYMLLKHDATALSLVMQKIPKWYSNHSE